MKVNVIDIISFLADNVINVFGVYDDVVVRHLREPKEVDTLTLDWINYSNKNKQKIAESSTAKVIIVDQEVYFSEKLQKQGKVLIQVEDPRLTISIVAQHFFLPKASIGVHSSAIIDHQAIVAPTAYIGAGCVLGKCIIESDTVLYPGVIVYDNVKIGKNCIIQAGSVIGTDGLGCQRLPDGTLVKFPHFGGVRIGNNVEIGANCQIAKGVLSNTIIGDGTKINGLCFIAHNCVLEKNVWITGDTMLAGSVKVEANVTIYSKVVIREHRVIGKGATIGMGLL